MKSPEPKSSETGPIFKVQILTSPKKLNTNDSRFKGTKDTDCYQEGRLFQYTVGASEDFNKINQLRKDLLTKFPEAFLIAFKDGKRVNVQDAIKEFKSKKVK